MTPLSPTALEEAAKAIYETWARNRSIDETWFGVCHVQHSIANEARQEATAAITAYLAQRERGVFVEVPKEPTEAMIEAGCDSNPTQWNEGTDLGFAADVANDVYRAMLAAAQNGAINE